MSSLKLVHSVKQNRSPKSDIALELLKLHRPPQKSAPPPKRNWIWAVLKLFSVCGSLDLQRQIGPGIRPELIERKGDHRLSFSSVR